MRRAQLRPVPLSTDAPLAVFANAGWKPVAAVLEGPDTCDLAFVVRNKLAVVARCVSRAQAADYSALKTMLREGDFERAILIQCDGDEPARCPDIETCSLDTLPQLLARWASENAPS